MDLDVFAVIGKPQPDISVFVVRGIVLDKMDSAGEIMAKNFFQVENIGHGIENGLELIKQSGGIQFDRSKEFEGIALTGGGDFRLHAYLGPRLIKGGILAEGGLVSKENRCAFPFGFFLMWG